MQRGDREAVELWSPDSHGDKLITKIRPSHTISLKLVQFTQTATGTLQSRHHIHLQKERGRRKQGGRGQSNVLILDAYSRTDREEWEKTKRRQRENGWRMRRAFRVCVGRRQYEPEDRQIDWNTTVDMHCRPVTKDTAGQSCKTEWKLKLPPIWTRQQAWPKVCQ